MEKYLQFSKVWEKMIYPFPNFDSGTIEVWKWIANFILYSMMDVVAYPCWDLS